MRHGILLLLLFASVLASPAWASRVITRTTRASRSTATRVRPAKRARDIRREVRRQVHATRRAIWRVIVDRPNVL